SALSDYYKAFEFAEMANRTIYGRKKHSMIAHELKGDIYNETKDIANAGQSYQNAMQFAAQSDDMKRLSLKMADVYLKLGDEPQFLDSIEGLTPTVFVGVNNNSIMAKLLFSKHL